MSTMSEQRRPSRKLVKRRKNIPKSTINLPERFKDGADAQEDYLAPKSETTSIANQPVFSMIAAVGSKTDFHTRFGDISDSEEDDVGSESSQADVDGVEETRRGRRSAEPGRVRESGESGPGMFRSMPQLHLRIRSPKPTRPTEDASALPSAVVETYTAHAEMQMPPPVEPRMGQLQERSVEENAREDDERRKSSMALAARLKEIFELADVKEVIAGTSVLSIAYCRWPDLTWVEYPCWLLKSVLLQGYMYITDRHILFYAYLPKKSVGGAPYLLADPWPWLMTGAECRDQVGTPLETWTSEPTLHEILVHSEGQCPVVLCRPVEPILPQQHHRPDL